MDIVYIILQIFLHYFPSSYYHFMEMDDKLVYSLYMVKGKKRRSQKGINQRSNPKIKVNCEGAGEIHVSDRTSCCSLTSHMKSWVKVLDNKDSFLLQRDQNSRNISGTFVKKLPTLLITLNTVPTVKHEGGSILFNVLLQHYSIHLFK